MSGALLAEFKQMHAMAAAARATGARNYLLLDAFSPCPVEGLADLLATRPSRVRTMMLLGGIFVAALAYGTEYYSAVIDYPYNSGGRPLNSWPAFMLVPFATGILGATIAGFITFLYETGLPRLHHPLFALDRFARASQDGFLLALARPDDERERHEAIDWLRQAGAASVWEVDT
jgi:hypothetical protein